MSYDSTEDTQNHISTVISMINLFIDKLIERAYNHDESKLSTPEKELFDKYTPLLKETVYGNEEYKQHLKEMGKALQHHYEHNKHHPEHYENGINDMTLIDIVEMYHDWKAASLRHNGDFAKSLEINKERFGMDKQLFEIFINTAKGE